MGHSAAVWDSKAAMEITKDCNGIDHVALRSPEGASARVFNNLSSISSITWGVGLL